MPHFVKDVEEIRQRAARKIEEGAVTESYRGDVEQSIEILNEALATEVVCVLRYMHHYFMATGVHGRGVADEFKEHADAEREHAEKIAERIQQLGGKPDFNPKGLLERSASQYVEGETLADMIREDLIAERMVIEVYQDMIRHFANNDPTTRHMIEEILKDEEEHASELADLLFITDPQTGKTEGEDPGTRPLELEQSGERQEGGKQGRAEGRERSRGGSDLDAREAVEALGSMGEGAHPGGQGERGGHHTADAGDGSMGVERGKGGQRGSEQRRERAQRQDEEQHLDSGSRRLAAAREDQKTEQFAGRGSARAAQRGKGGKKNRAA